jgi:alpha-N-arabinofuranosidase
LNNTIDIDASHVECEINPMIYGHFIENMARCIYGGLLQNERPGRVRGPWKRREDVVRWIKDLRPPVVRWPGGLYADGYFWRDGVGPRDARPLRRNRYWSRYGPFTRVLDPNWFGSDEFMELADELGAEPYVNVNVGTGTAAEAARWVEYMNGDERTAEGRRRASFGHREAWGVRYWGIGNEMYAFWTLGHSGSREYAGRYLEFRAAMSEVDPEVRCVAVGCDTYFNKGWNREVLSEAGGDVDLLSVHVYLPGPERGPEVAASRALHGATGMYKAIVAAPLEIERRLLRVEKDISSVMGGDSDVHIALDEWNLWWKPSQLLLPRWTLRDALFVCGVFHSMHRTAGFVKMANIAQLVNVLGVLSASGSRAFRSTIYHAFLLYRKHGHPLKLKTEVGCASFDSPRLGGIPRMAAVPALDCSATLSSDGKTMTVFVINRHLTESLRAELRISGFGPRGDAEVHCLNGPSEGAMNWYGRDDLVKIDSSESDVGDVLPTFDFPAHSATALILRA